MVKRACDEPVLVDALWGADRRGCGLGGDFVSVRLKLVGMGCRFPDIVPMSVDEGGLSPVESEAFSCFKVIESGPPVAFAPVLSNETLFTVIGFDEGVFALFDVSSEPDDVGDWDSGESLLKDSDFLGL